LQGSSGAVGRVRRQDVAVDVLAAAAVGQAVHPAVGVVDAGVVAAEVGRVGPSPGAEVGPAGIRGGVEDCCAAENNSSQLVVVSRPVGSMPRLFMALGTNEALAVFLRPSWMLVRPWFQ
jgi:hypothetical protein